MKGQQEGTTLPPGTAEIHLTRYVRMRVVSIANQSMQSAVPMTRTQRNFKNRPTPDVRDDVKPAAIHLVNGDTIDAADHDTTDAWCIVYRAATTGVAKKIPRESILYIDRCETVNGDSHSENGGGE